VALVIAALGADGDSVVHDIHHVERGYEDLPDKLRRLGAEVEAEVKVDVWSDADDPSYDAR
jgi:UDP-N-acetylglucosamine 1-carboxyvinyltransferase